MRNLYQFIIRNHFFFLFLLMEVLALLLTFSKQQYHQTFFLHSANTLSAKTYQIFDRVISYANLRQVNQELVEENLLLLEWASVNFLITDQEAFTLNDSLFQRRFTYRHARVINNSVNRRNNYMTLNKGRAHGIAPDMGVLSPYGVLGIVKNVSENFSSVMSLLHSDMMLSVKMKKNNHIGTLRWEGPDYRLAHVGYIPPHLDLARGDTILTSGFSSIFPENIFIGTVYDWELRRGENFYTLRVELAKDFNRITQVYVVENLFGEEQQALEDSPHQRPR